MADKNPVDDFYRQTFGTAFEDQTPEDRKFADAVVAALHSYPHTRTKAMNQALQQASERGIDLGDPATLRGLGIYSAYRAGLVPDKQLDEKALERLRAAGIPQDKIQQEIGNREAATQKWGQGVINSFAHYARQDDPNTKPAKEASMKVKEKPRPQAEPMVNPTQAQAPAPPPPAGIAAPGVEGGPPMMAPPPAIAADPGTPQMPPGGAVGPGDMNPYLNYAHTIPGAPNGGL